MPSRASREGESTTPVPFWYNGPSQLVERVATAVATLGQILPIPHPAAGSNATYTVNFHGPALHCHAMDSSQVVDVQNQTVNYTFGSHQYYGSPYGYLAWTSGRLPLVASEPYEIDCYGEISIGRNYTVVSDSLSTDRDPGTLYITTVPALWRIVPMLGHAVSPLCSATTHTAGINATNPLGWFSGGFSASQCQLYNSSYNVNFNYTNGEQDITIDNELDLAAGPITTARQVYGPGTFSSTQYISPNVSTTLSLSPDDCDFNETLVQTLAYEAVMDAFNKLLVGSISANIAGSGGELALTRNSGIVSTTLVQSPELQFLRDREPVRNTEDEPELSYASLQQTLAGFASTNAVLEGLTNAEKKNSSTSFQQP